MKVFSTTTELQKELALVKGVVGFVPTMGALHQGHIALIKEAIAQSDYVVCSIFVNPIQFNNKEDLAKYPRNIEQDLELLEEAGCHAVFVPSEEDVYAKEVTEEFNFGFLENTMEGAFRPGHFFGVAVVVSRLFDIVKPQKAFFGEKDFQQLAIIKRMVADLQLPVTIVPCAIVREPDGLAMSSRNIRLSADERDTAPFIYQILKQAKQFAQHKKPDEIKKIVEKQFQNNPLFKLEYFDIVDDITLESISDFQSHKGVVGCIATWLGNVRLIDVIRFK